MKSDMPVLDERDYMLIELLRRNARMPYSRLAGELGLSESAVRKRIQRLIRLGVIERFTIDYSLPGEATAIVLVRTSPPSVTPRVAASILGLEGVDRVYEVTGDYDILCVVRASSIADLNRIVDYIRGLEGVSSTHTIMALRTYVPRW